MIFTPDMPIGHYWLRQDSKRLTGPIDGIVKGYLEIVYISGDTTFRRKACRLVIGKHWQETLVRMIEAQSPDWKLSGPIVPPSFD